MNCILCDVRGKAPEAAALSVIIRVRAGQEYERLVAGMIECKKHSAVIATTLALAQREGLIP